MQCRDQDELKPRSTWNTKGKALTKGSSPFFHFSLEHFLDMPTISPLALTTELDAVNAMLASIGESRITNLVSNTNADVLLAVDIIRRVAAEVQSRGWKFNTEFGYEISPSATYLWTGRDGSTETLNIFRPPTTPLLLGFEVSEGKGQTGTSKPDVVLRKSRNYTTGAPAVPVIVFYDRVKNRDGFSDRAFLYIDPTWLLEFEDLPQEAKYYIALRAARQFAEKAVGSAELSGYSEKDEGGAWRPLKRRHGLEDNYNMLESADVGAVLLHRQSLPSGRYDDRSNVGPA